MPKQTFLNLPIDKQETLINSAMREFSRAPLHEATIANIVKHAGISRGSFYQYFEDKEDIFFFILEKHTEKNHEKFISLLKENDGDLIDALIKMYKLMLNAFHTPDYRIYIKNVFLNMNHKIANTIINNEDLDNLINHRAEIIRFVNKDKLHITDEQELLHFLSVTDAITLLNLIQDFALELSFEESLQNYTAQINLLIKN
ncbi:transcriptional regulator [Sporosarcina newyorkensis 2681]|uniref:Transcriptional regulator n=1 Tax=Sporosarcina newyorkensis 2681 TaxID=1027292 RepID=F9DQY4_9BACL|nr:MULTISPECIES: TetR family transcriptional regulator [Sporosarcina]EGQ26782.1 transcriptional regulator [Sporosarcina newyorkensis 2681]MBY0221639.1 TetR family transcriptional regulator [Sporosarcina aquimarina]